MFNRSLDSDTKRYTLKVLATVNLGGLAFLLMVSPFSYPLDFLVIILSCFAGWAGVIFVYGEKGKDNEWYN